MCASSRPACMVAQLWRPSFLLNGAPIKLHHHPKLSTFAPRCCSLSIPSPIKKKIVFLGTPQVAADVLDKLLVAGQADDSIFEVAAVVTQPPSAKGRGQKLIPSPVAQLAMDRGFPTSHIFWPEKAREDTFLAGMKELNPDLCVTAAYGNFLPNRFLKIPSHGTVNIHPSLLPLYRGAAPVQRAIQDGVSVTGVTVAYTVRLMDAGPIIASETMEIDDHIKAPKLLLQLFGKGVQLLLRELPNILDGSAAETATEQDHTMATHAAKVNMDEAWLNFEKHAVVLHNEVRAFADWPGARAKFQICKSTGEQINLEIKIITTKPFSGLLRTENKKNVVKHGSSSLLIHCEGDSGLEILELQPAGKRIMSGRDFLNGLRGQQLNVIQ